MNLNRYKGPVRWIGLVVMLMSGGAQQVAVAQTNWHLELSGGALHSSVERDAFWSSPSVSADLDLFPEQLGESKTAAQFGLHLTRSKSAGSAFQTGLVFQRKGLYNQFEDLNAELDYLTIPLTLVLLPRSTFSAHIGVEPSILLQERKWGGLEPSPFDAGAAFGLGVKTPVEGLSVSLDFTRGTLRLFELDFLEQTGSEESYGYFNSAMTISARYVIASNEGQENKKLKRISFNEFDRNDDIERIFVCPNLGVDCSGRPTDAQDIATLTETMLLGEYDVLERRHFEQVLQEQIKSASGLILEEAAIELGCVQGSQGVLFVEEGCIEGKRMISLKLVGCSSSEIHWSCIGLKSSTEEVVKAVKKNLAD